MLFEGRGQGKRTVSDCEPLGIVLRPQLLCFPSQGRGIAIYFLQIIIQVLAVYGIKVHQAEQEITDSNVLSVIMCIAIRERERDEMVVMVSRDEGKLLLVTLNSPATFIAETT